MNTSNSRIPSLLRRAVLFIPMLAASMAFAASGEGTFPTPERLSEPSDMKFHVGALLGVTDPFGSASPAFEYGVDAGFQPFVPLSLGLQINRFGSGNSSQPDGASVSRTSVLGKAAYNFGGELPIIKSSYVGVKLGPTFEELGGDHRTRVEIGPMVGYDYMLCPHMSVGGELSYLAIIGPDSADELSLNGLIKYWF